MWLSLKCGGGLEIFFFKQYHLQHNYLRRFQFIILLIYLSKFEKKCQKRKVNKILLLVQVYQPNILFNSSLLKEGQTDFVEMFHVKYGSRN